MGATWILRGQPDFYQQELLRPVIYGNIKINLHFLPFYQNSEFPCMALTGRWEWFNTLRPRQSGRRFADDILKCIFLNENVSIVIKISLKFVPNGQINNIPSLVQIMAWRQPGDKPLSEAMLISLLTHICVTRPQWVKSIYSNIKFQEPLNRKRRGILHSLDPGRLQ